MRDLKFRVFSPITREFNYAYVNDTDEIETWLTWEKPEESPINTGIGWEIDQCTGLKDKNCVDIYEGDICVNEKGRIAECIYHEPSASFDFVALNCIGDNYGYSPQMWKYKLAVIGNIHQNPEFLK